MQRRRGRWPLGLVAGLSLAVAAPLSCSAVLGLDGFGYANGEDGGLDGSAPGAEPDAFEAESSVAREGGADALEAESSAPRETGSDAPDEGRDGSGPPPADAAADTLLPPCSQGCPAQRPYCVSGTCAACVPRGLPCEKNGTCCLETNVAGGACVQAADDAGPVCCAAATTPCSPGESSLCCSNTCVSGFCCIPNGGACTANGDCCGTDMECNQRCCSRTGPCTTGAECCGGTCNIVDGAGSCK